MTPCETCRIRAGCDFLSGLCSATPAQIVRHRPDLIKPLTAQQRWYRKNRERINIADRKRYQANRATKIAKVMEWQRNNPERRAEHQRRYAANVA